ncbi:MAG TPA: TolC family protein, partial [Kofleriaceae bacterium]
AFAQDADVVDEALARASGVAGGITSDQVADAARATSPELAARAADVAAADAALSQARDAYIPRLAVTARYVRLSDITPPSLGDLVVAPGAPAGPLSKDATLVNVPFSFPVYLNATTFDAQLDIPISDDLLRISRGVAAAKHTAGAARFSADAEQRDVAANSRLAYYAWARARLSAIVAADAVHQAELHLSDVQQRAQADRASRADVMAVQAQLAAATQMRVRADDLERSNETQLRIALHGDAPHGALAIGEDLSTNLPLGELDGDDALLAAAIAHRPELRAAGESIDALVEQAHAARDSALPHIDLIADATSANPNERYIPPDDKFHTTWSAGAQLTWNVTDVPAQLAAARSLLSRAASAEAARAQLVDALRGELAQATASVRDAASAQVTTQQQLESAEEAYRVRRALFREGEATSTELTDAETARTRAQLDAVGARIEARIASVRLAHAVGRD